MPLSKSYPPSFSTGTRRAGGARSARGAREHRARRCERAVAEFERAGILGTRVFVHFRDRRAGQHVVKLIAQNDLPRIAQRLAHARHHLGSRPHRQAPRSLFFRDRQLAFELCVGALDVAVRRIHAAMIFEVQLVIVHGQFVAALGQAREPELRAFPRSRRRRLAKLFFGRTSAAVAVPDDQRFVALASDAYARSTRRRPPFDRSTRRSPRRRPDRANGIDGAGTASYRSTAAWSSRNRRCRRGRAASEASARSRTYPAATRSTARPRTPRGRSDARTASGAAATRPMECCSRVRPTSPRRKDRTAPRELAARSARTSPASSSRTNAYSCGWLCAKTNAGSPSISPRAFANVRAALRRACAYVHNHATSRWPCPHIGSGGVSIRAASAIFARAGSISTKRSGSGLAVASKRIQRSPGPGGRPLVGSERRSTSKVSSRTGPGGSSSP